MPYSYKFDPIAAIEYEEAYLWYYERNIKAAEGFQKAIENAITSVCSGPFRYRNT